MLGGRHTSPLLLLLSATLLCLWVPPSSAYLCTSLDYFGCDQYGNCPQCEPCTKHADCRSVCTSSGCFCHEEGFCLNCVEMQLGTEELLQGVEVLDNQTGHRMTIYFKTCHDFAASIDGSCNTCTCQVSEDCATDENIGTNKSAYCSQVPALSESLAKGRKYCYPCRDMLGVHCTAYDDAVDSCSDTCDDEGSALGFGAWVLALSLLLAFTLA